MEQYIPKSVLVTEIKKYLEYANTGVLYAQIGVEKGLKKYEHDLDVWEHCQSMCENILSSIDTIEVTDSYEQHVQYDSIKAGIQAHAETYSFNIESELFNQLTKEQQKLWRKEIEQACISGGEAGVELARDIRYKENAEVKKVDLENIAAVEWDDYIRLIDGEPDNSYMLIERNQYIDLAKHFFELYSKAQEGK